MDTLNAHFYVSSGRGDVCCCFVLEGGFFCTGLCQLSLLDPFIFCSLWTFIIIKLREEREKRRMRGKTRTGRKRDYVK